MDTSAHIAALRADSAALVKAARRGWEPRVPACPEWSVADLVAHTGRVHRAVTRRVRDLDTERRSASDIEIPEPAGLAAWFADGAEALALVLEAAEPDAPVWNWSLEPNLAVFWWRRMAQETAVHRWDAQSAHGQQQPIQTDVAVDGIDEFLDVFLPTDVAEQPAADLGGALALRCTDAPSIWLVTVVGGMLAVRRAEPTGAVEDATVSATASDLLLLLWRRVTPVSPGIQVDGDTALVAQFAALADLT